MADRFGRERKGVGDTGPEFSRDTLPRGGWTPDLGDVYRGFRNRDITTVPEGGGGGGDPFDPRRLGRYDPFNNQIYTDPFDPRRVGIEEEPFDPFNPDNLGTAFPYKEEDMSYMSPSPFPYPGRPWPPIGRPPWGGEGEIDWVGRPGGGEGGSEFAANSPEWTIWNSIRRKLGADAANRIMGQQNVNRGGIMGLI